MATLLTALNLSKTYSTRMLFSGVAMSLDDRERLALIGPNGSGKSTLLKIIAGLETPDEGAVSLRKGVRAAYVPQSDVFPEGSSVLSAVTAALAAANLARFHDDHEIELGAELTLARIGFTDFAQPTASLSGGQRKRLAIARETAKEPDILLLDEPTNHLDVEGIMWLEDLLRAASFGSITITHDRSFLESTASRIIELARAYPGGTFSIRGNYSEFLRRKEEFLDAQAKQEQSLANTVRDDLRWLARGAKARRTKSKSRIDASFERIDELDELRARNAPQKAAAIDFTATERRTQKLLAARAISKSFGGKRLFTDLDLVLSPGDKLGLMGPNGSGKTTLIRVIMGELRPDPPTPEAIAAAEEARRTRSAPPGMPDPGEIRRADNLRIVLFSQHRTEIDPAQSLREALSPHADSVIYRGQTVHVTSWARRFLFTDEQLKNPVRSLSGGEQARIHIARLMLEPADILILDEPTNDLDIPSLEVLEESLEDFPGALVLVTHDRAMIARLATRILALGGSAGGGGGNGAGSPGSEGAANGVARYFTNYEQWERARKAPASPPPEPLATKAAVAPGAASPSSASTARKKLSYKEQRELDQMEANIHQSEAEAARLEGVIADPATAADHKKLADLYHALGQVQTRIADLYRRWEELDSRA
jgi:ABC transport system ATP-binding/permease protein